MGKLHMSKMFPDIDFLRVVAMMYDLITWVVHDNEGKFLLTIKGEKIQ
jgi:hypothetical protein